MLEFWAGPECTVNRVGDEYRDQFAETGHDQRLSDLDLFAGLGIKALRYPVLWERVAPNHPEQRDWAWSDARLARLRELDVRAIVGLVHHGSGPRYTNLLDAGFAEGLAQHARAVAERYPWITDWTPVNEPVTTARFAALYGHWYPHHRDERSFWTALLNQVDATRLAMRAVRSVNPSARLIQTEDLGRTYATVAVRDQAAFDNTRRWMSWDLLCGRVIRGHALWAHLGGFGLEDRLRAIADDPCPPDVIGVNHYLTSDRFLDHRVSRYPHGVRGANAQQRFVDVEAVRVLQPPVSGLRNVLLEAWRRYGIPLAITEVHNGCTREEQLRWMADACRTVRALRDDGVDVRAITAWALLGSRGWNTLLTAPGLYEPGAYDVSGGRPRPTALAAQLQSLALTGESIPHPVLAGQGWWQRSMRLHHPAVPRPAPIQDQPAGATDHPQEGTPILIVGATGTLGGALAAACRHRHLHHVATTRSDFDLGDPGSIRRALDQHRPWAVINAGGWVRVDEAEGAPDACFAVNAAGAERLVRACADRDIPSACFSSDLVFGSEDPQLHTEAAVLRPLSAYGRSKAAMEQAVAAIEGRHLIVRTAAFFSPFDPHNFAVHATGALARGAVFPAAEDQVVSPTYVPDLCNAVLDLIIDGEEGIWHLTNGEAVSWAEFARRLAETLGLDGDLVMPVAGRTLGWVAARPRHVGLTSSRGTLLPPLQTALDRFATEIRQKDWMPPIKVHAVAG